MNEPSAIYSPILACKTMGAFIVAVSRQASPLPANLQAEIHGLGQQIQANDQLLEQPIRLIRPLLADHLDLSLAYDAARVELEEDSFNCTRGELSNFIKRYTTAEIIDIFKVVCTATDSFEAARKALKPSTNLLQRIQRLWPS